MLSRAKDCFRPPVCGSPEPRHGVKVQDTDQKIRRSAACLDELGEEA